MKNILPLLFGAALLPVAASAQSTSNVVGYITHTLTGTNTGGTPIADTYVTPSLVQPLAFQAQANASPSGSLTVTFAGTPVPTLDPVPYVLEITSGAQEGWWADVASATNNSITLTAGNEFPAGLPADVSVSLRKHNTLDTFLGANTPGLTPWDGVTSIDEVQILNPATGAAPAYGWIAIPGAEGWYRISTGLPAPNVIISPGSAVLIRRTGLPANSPDLTFQSVGEVKTTDTQVDIYPGSNWLGTPLAVGQGITDMKLWEKLLAWDGVNLLDDLQFITPAGQIASSYAAVPSASSMFTVLGLPSNLLWPEGGGAVLVRRADQAGSVVTFNGQVVAP